ncbi:bifunctional isocitrate dehydrogenase kinase/phosphatase [Oceanisphaera sp. DM8]|uniref:Isocitrate dehydrogenase kinase/phosphatase n=2 Tax=Oceanisphaera pacifica TaxID=2818389 RepID=A0ABS3NHD1_9GAMM|nr:bifunctional isocitrate dehydrogenase kinase/phosphatase [Oceanisphaera pacifica]
MTRFEEFYGCFLDITKGAQGRFERQDWEAVQEAGVERIRLYDQHVKKTVQAIRDQHGHARFSASELKSIKQAFNDLLIKQTNPEIAESFYNSVYRRLFRHKNIYANNLYVHRFISCRSATQTASYCQSYHTRLSELDSTLSHIIEKLGLSVPFCHLSQDVAYVRRYLEEVAPAVFAQQELQIDVINSLFFRNKGAYLIARIQCNNMTLPFILPILHHKHGGLYIDTLILSYDDASILFSFSRAYFMVWCPEAAPLVQFLRPLLPSKADHEIYSAIGCQKHGKTEFYRDFLQQLHQSRDQFVLAPGIKGMVMSVFTLPSFNIVFKIIKDKFTPPKVINHETVRAKYKLVKQHDRVGRMADTMQFTNFELPLDRISPELLEELQKVAPSQLTITEHTLIIHHLYTERRMTPLNLYLEQASEQARIQVLDEYANAIKQLATANIFPGDMLFKNFGVTRHNRVIFYDYDEISYMTECHFRDIPKARYPEDAFSAEPWYSVAENDIFPEEFATFLLSSPKIRDAFNLEHHDLFTADYWRGLQDKITNGQFGDVFPYSQQQRFHVRYG